MAQSRIQTVRKSSPRPSVSRSVERSLGERVGETVQVLRAKGVGSPRVGIILGTGLGGLLKEVRQSATIAYPDLPHMPRSTAPTHRGEMVYGAIGKTGVVVMDGRFHLYEGYSAREVAYPVWVLKALGVETLLISNVAGGLNPEFRLGDVMVVTDHINLQGTSPLVGPNDDQVGLRFPDMIEPYDARLAELALSVGQSRKLPMQRGVYVGVVGPQLETKAEYRWLRAMGADAVGMSTVPEVIAAVHCGLKVLTVSLISDLCIPETLKPVNIEKIIAVANRAEPLLTQLFTGVVQRL